MLLLLTAVFTKSGTSYFYFYTTATGVAPFRILIQNDGNVRILDSKDLMVWQTNTAGA